MIRVGRWLAVCVFFFAFPLFLVNLGIRHALDRNWDSYTTAVARRVGGTLERLRARGDEQTFLYGELKRLGERLDAAHDLRRSAAGLCGRLETAIPGLFEVYIVDGRHRLVWPDRMPMGVSGYQLRRLAEAMSQIGTNPGAKMLIKRNAGMFSYFLSDAPPLLDLVSMSLVRRVAEVNPAGFRTWFGAWFGTRTGVVAVMNRRALRKWQFLNLMVGRANRRQNMIRFGISRYGGRDTGGEHPSVIRRREALAWLEDSSEDAFRIRDDRLFMRLNLDPVWRVWADVALDVSHRGDIVRNRVLALSVALLLLFSGASFGLLVAGWNIPMALRLRVMVLFAMATGLPLSGLAVAGYDDLQKTRDVLIESGRRQLAESLRAIEGGLPRFGRLYAGRLARLRDSFYRPGSAYDFPGFAKRLFRVSKSMKGKSPVVLLKDGRAFRVEGHSERETMLEGISIELIRRYNRSLGLAAKEPEKFLLASLVLDDNTARKIMTGIIRARGQISHLNFGTEDKFSCMDFILGPGGSAEGVFFVTWDPRDLALSYLQQDILRRQRQLAHSRLFAIHDWDPARCVPVEAAGLPWLKRFVERLRARRTELFDEVIVDGRRWLLAGMPGREIQEYLLIQAVPVDRLTGQVDGLRSDIIWGCILCLLLSLGVAAALAQQILRPVAVLTSGVDAMRDGRYRTRLPVQGNDEFGALTVSFNQALERLEELSTARAFQERLFPADTLRVGTTEITGICQTATELGGDYFDYFEIGEGRVVILIGDVAGHGAGSALLMAMAKGFVSVESRRNGDPAHVLAGLNEMIFSSMSRRLMMSMCYGLLQTDTGLLRIANAGHCPPWIVRNGASEAVEIRPAVGGYPLGTRRNIVYRCEEIRLSPGDRVWFFTDGFPETLGPRGEPLGYPGLAAMLMKADGTDTRARCRELHRLCSAWRGRAAQTDDMTAILLENHAAG
ncbi:MAG TPA: SpoIIE family protein phosphatase [Candidatus Ozemobacteraceae bacterium]|nr:SpoIIE family protein phosphatase [Candidatus Ozemobacteraceae bacterium]